MGKWIAAAVAPIFTPRYTLGRMTGMNNERQSGSYGVDEHVERGGLLRPVTRDGDMLG